ncbi:hypothetical protein Dxin01_04023 [Deinococcus xinjiangensis]|uniref:Type I restriction modification DNA specificity domain-containing protein n=1 Tax=Deinococcus xinjiangensis TaxID=457454 RepID=A0ABP9VGB2_9DEIO
MKSNEQEKKKVPAPRLRFKQFEGMGEWKEKTISDLLAVRNIKKPPSEDIPLFSLTIEDGVTAKSERYDREFLVGKKEQKTYKVVMPNDLVYNPANLRWGAIAVSKIRHPVVVSPIYEVLYKRPDIEFNENFVFESLMRPEQIKVFCLKGQGTLVERIAVKIDDFVTESIPLPPTLPEQTHIAACLSSLDAVITAHTDKLDALRQHKRALMQELFPQGGERVPRLRFPEFEGNGEWEEKEVGEVFTVTRGLVLSMTLVSDKPDLEKKYPVYSSQTKNKGLAGYYSDYLYQDAITWTTDGANAGDTNYREGKFYCTNVCGVLLNSEGYANLFVAELLNTVTRNHVSYVGNPKLMNGVMSKIKIPLPTLPEQQRIAACLSSLDDLITAQSEKIDELKTFKRGLMQGLFPSTNHEAAE